MELKLAKDEVMVKSWDYAYQGGMFTRDKLQANLTVTNKRIVSTVENKIRLDRDQIALSEVRSISASYGACRTFWARVKLVLGIIFCVTIIGLIIGIPMIKNALATLRACDLDIILETRYPRSEMIGEPFEIGAYSAAPTRKRNFIVRFLALIPIIGRIFRPKGAKEKPIRVNKELAKEIVNEIGAAIMDSQN